MEKLGLNEIRERFLSFFASKGHRRMPSFSLVPQGDNSLLLINSGMAPLKPYFMGECKIPENRATTCQKCIRTPDIESVGKDDRHGTFFEMLGNFSFGDYFKKDAIKWAWEFLTQQLGLPEDKLWVSVYEEDDEAKEIWMNEVGLPENRIVKFGKEENFWEIGTGPCGPDSEIYFDRGEKYGCGKPDCKVGCDCDRFIEVWNLVFSQYNRDEEGNYTPLKHKNIDTGMGLERIACVVQDVGNLFEVDTVKNIMLAAGKIAGVNYKDNPKTDVALRIITDHIRSTTMMISDGILPSNEGRGYVLRRLLRRAARYGKLLGIKGCFLCDLCETVINESCRAYPELSEKSEYIKKVIQAEEERFAKTIDKGMLMLNDAVERMKKNGETVFSGEEAFKLSDTFGFPIDLTNEILEEYGFKADEEKFRQLMKEQKQRARKAREELGDFSWVTQSLDFDKNIKTEFVGYSEHKANAKVLAIFGEEGRIQSALGDDVTVILDKTPFYAECGGQVADKGMMSNSKCTVKVNDVKKTPNGQYLHSCTVIDGILSENDDICAEIDENRRCAVSRAHSSAHLLQKALRNVLGTHVEQAGSLVTPDKVRFDFTNFSALTDEQIAEVEETVNKFILADMPVNTVEMPVEEAKKTGAMALFGEKYGDVVRVVNMGGESIELCGGTHLSNTAKAGAFKIVSESSVAAGVRRIEAVTGPEVFRLVNKKQDIINQTAEILRAGKNDLQRRALQVTEEIKELNKQITALKNKGSADLFGKLQSDAREFNGIKLICSEVESADNEQLRSICDRAKELQNMVCVLASANDGKISFAASCGKEAVKNGMHAGNILKKMAAITGGGGGGRPDVATAGGKDLSKLSDALGSIDEILGSMLAQ